MREIEFRGKLTNNRGWAYGNLSIKPNNECAIITPDDTVIGKYGKVDIDTVGQFTGLTDKNGRKIFEGDIVKVYSDCDGYYTEKQYLNGVILFDEEYFFEYIISFNHIRICCEENIGNHRDNIEVIGNIYDNKELLEENK